MYVVTHLASLSLSHFFSPPLPPNHRDSCHGYAFSINLYQWFIIDKGLCFILISVI